ncbi:E3 ubiquitin-protein ligase RNF181 isoform 1-T1 [Vipera latastei]
MASYFEEHDCEPGAAPEERLPPRRALLELARSLFHGLEIDVGALQGSDWDHRLPPPAARRAVEDLPEVRVSAPQADQFLPAVPPRAAHRRPGVRGAQGGEGSEAAASAPAGVSPWRDVHVTLQCCLHHLGQQPQGFSQLQRTGAASGDKKRRTGKSCPPPPPEWHANLLSAFSKSRELRAIFEK